MLAVSFFILKKTSINCWDCWDARKNKHDEHGKQDFKLYYLFSLYCWQNIINFWVVLMFFLVQQIVFWKDSVQFNFILKGIYIRLDLKRKKRRRSLCNTHTHILLVILILFLLNYLKLYDHDETFSLIIIKRLRHSCKSGEKNYFMDDTSSWNERF